MKKKGRRSERGSLVDMEGRALTTEGAEAGSGWCWPCAGVSGRSAWVLQGQRKGGGRNSTSVAMGCSTMAETFSTSCTYSTLWRRQDHPAHFRGSRLQQATQQSDASQVAQLRLEPKVLTSRLCFFFSLFVFVFSWISITYWGICPKAEHDENVPCPLECGLDLVSSFKIINQKGENSELAVEDPDRCHHLNHVVKVNVSSGVMGMCMYLIPPDMMEWGSYCTSVIFFPNLKPLPPHEKNIRQA